MLLYLNPKRAFETVEEMRDACTRAGDQSFQNACVAQRCGEKQAARRTLYLVGGVVLAYFLLR